MGTSTPSRTDPYPHVPGVGVIVTCGAPVVPAVDAEPGPLGSRGGVLDVRLVEPDPGEADAAATRRDALVPPAGPGMPWIGNLAPAGKPDPDLPDPGRGRRRVGAEIMRGLDAAYTTHVERLGRRGLPPVGLAEPPLVQIHPGPITDVAAVEALVTGLVAGAHRLRVRRGPRSPRWGVRLVADADPAIDRAVGRGMVLGSATVFARDLAGMPAGRKTPHWLAERAVDAMDGVPATRVTVHDEAWLRRRGFGGVLAVGEGSSRPPRLVVIRYRPADRAGGHLGLVGKGVTFDSGGLSIKPAAGMDLMRTDMAGGAAVIAAVRAIAQLALPLAVTAVVPMAENLISGTSYRPGDVVDHVDGTTSEITNTDAEGRLVLADALGYLRERFDPDLVVDVATLTGAMKIALGTRTGAVFSSDDALAARVRAAGASVGEAWWQLPLIAAHEDAVRSELADLRQAPEGPGAVMAALFLRHFTGEKPWVHLDIAGPARTDSTYDEVVPLASGFATRTLVAFAEAVARERP